MNNPWKELPEHPPYLLPAEQRAISAFNRKAQPKYQIRAELLPEPYIGHPDADILFLNLNPGFSEADAPFQAQPAFKQRWWANILHQEAEYPFYLLDPALDQTKDGAAWWSKKLKKPIQLTNRRRVAECFCCIEYFPYHTSFR